MEKGGEGAAADQGSGFVAWEARAAGGSEDPEWQGAQGGTQLGAQGPGRSVRGEELCAGPVEGGTWCGPE